MYMISSGLEAIYYLTRTVARLSIFMENWEGEKKTANYSSFRILGSADNYILQVGTTVDAVYLLAAAAGQTV